MCGKSDSGWELIGSWGGGGGWGHWVNVFAYPYNWKGDKNKKMLVMSYFCFITVGFYLCLMKDIM